MSTWWYFECLDHDPPLASADEFTQHTEDRHWDNALELVKARPVGPDESYWSGNFGSDAERSHAYFDMNARKFLSAHPTCRLGLINEYEERQPIPEVIDD